MERMLREYLKEIEKKTRRSALSKRKKKNDGHGPRDKGRPRGTLRKNRRERRVEAVEELKVINLSEDDEKTTKIGTTMRPSTEEHLIQFLKKNKEVFAWTMTDLHGISPDVITHKLSVNPSAKPPNGKWRLCIDFTDLNKACPKDPFPLPRIDILVDSTSGCEMLSFLDAYQGYNQIPLAPEDQEKASFVTDQGVFCYNVMPFGLKNAGATYQRLVNHMFQNQIGRNMEVYIDDMLVKSEKEQDHIKDLEECFQILTTFGMKLNPAKCTFGVRGGRFLGYMISERGIEANPEKINAIMDMSPPKSIREVQKLAGRLAALNRFISRSADKGLPFFKILRGGAKFEWSKNGQEAFDELKKYLVSPPLLTKPETGETLYLYLAVSENAVSSVLVRQENREHLPVYYVSKVLQGAEPRYSQIEKLALSLVIAARKLRPYFQSHQVTVLTNHPLKQLLASPKLSGRMVKWQWN
ncbi:UNVERIFIED_CONTAM: Retrovirus-related Pol polyprotein from transposon [Sesamum calycinum]|uniref:Retrovirus-related Pol polyprotein from transposon n=1 Tax=Sesamum calycinum TaxID=2727403 RepID=A0AAW2J9T9_9LAMI